MNIYKISCASDCGSYFNSYLQSVTVIAKDKEDAIKYVTKWMEKPLNGSFIYPYERTKKDIYKRDYVQRWNVELLLEDIGDKKNDIIDYFEDSDY